MLQLFQLLFDKTTLFGASDILHISSLFSANVHHCSLDELVMMMMSCGNYQNIIAIVAVVVFFLVAQLYRASTTKCVLVFILLYFAFRVIHYFIVNFLKLGSVLELFNHNWALVIGTVVDKDVIFCLGKHALIFLFFNVYLDIDTRFEFFFFGHTILV